MKFLVCLGLLTACSGPRPAPGTSPAAGGAVIAERLSNQRVNAFAEDGDGHIWIGTFRGLDKYTVHDYHQYFATGDSLGLPDNQVTALLAGSSGRLWVATMNGVAVRESDGRFHAVPGFGGNFSSILETRDGRILFSDGATLQRYDTENGRIRPVIRDYGGVFTLIGPDGDIWSVNNLTEIRRYDARTFQLAGSWPTRHQTYHGTFASTGELWLSGMGELSIFDPRSESWLEVPTVIRSERRLSGGDIDILFANGPDLLLHTISDGMFCYNQASGRLLHQDDPAFPYEIPDFEIRTIFRDSRGNLWLGSSDQGYSVSYAARNGFENKRFLTDFFENKSVVSVCPDRSGHLWISTLNDGLYVHDLAGKEVRRIDLRRLVPDNNIGYIRCSGVFCDAQDEVWLVLTEKYRVLRCRYDGRDLRTVDQVDVINPVTVSQDDLGRIWIANYTGLLGRYDKDTRKTEWGTLRENIFGPHGPAPVGTGPHARRHLRHDGLRSQHQLRRNEVPGQIRNLGAHFLPHAGQPHLLLQGRHRGPLAGDRRQRPPAFRLPETRTHPDGRCPLPGHLLRPGGPAGQRLGQHDERPGSLRPHRGRIHQLL